MKTIYFCGHTGSVNHGCEAIIRSTAKILSLCGYLKKPILMTTNKDSDEFYNLDLIAKLIPYKRNYPDTVIRLYTSFRFRILHNLFAGQEYLQKELFDRVDPYDICFNVGGDTYCYGTPIVSLALNRGLKRRNVPSVLWCCSIEKEIIKGKIKQDLLKYKYIVAREIITYNNLRSAGIPENKILKSCDPAFLLDASKVSLPEEFEEGNTIGINISTMVIKSFDDSDVCFRNVKNLINKLLEKTDYHICFIPHVYDAEKGTGDIACNEKMLQYFKGNSRISQIEKNYTCEELKYIISKCKFFIGARTHATIAAYSSCVPTLVIGYSVKSKGIATDLFGDYSDYVVPYDTLKNDDDLTDLFFNNIIKNADKIISLYKRVLPDYTSSVLKAARKIVSELDEKNNLDTIKDIVEKQCCGCGACAQSCNRHAIVMQRDHEGFLRPIVNEALCVKCRMCVEACPIMREEKINCALPKTYFAYNNQEVLRNASSSGGVFSAIAKKIIEAGGVVIGACADEKMHIAHFIASNEKELGLLRGSKYVQSEIGETFRLAQKYLDENREVLFSGTPCEVAGLKSFLKKEYDNLYTVDLICHGCPSPLIWEKYIEMLENNENSQIVSVNFRDKTKSKKPYSFTADFKDGHSFSEPANQNDYMKMFLRNMSIRPSCSSCNYKNINRVSDITLGDFWGVSKLIPDAEEGNNSLIFLHSPKGQALVSKCDITKIEMPFRDSIKENVSYSQSSEASVFRNYVFPLVKKYGFAAAAKKYCTNGIRQRIIWESEQFKVKL